MVVGEQVDAAVEVSVRHAAVDGVVVGAAADEGEQELVAVLNSQGRPGVTDVVDAVVGDDGGRVGEHVTLAASVDRVDGARVGADALAGGEAGGLGGEGIAVEVRGPLAATAVAGVREDVDVGDLRGEVPAEQAAGGIDPVGLLHLAQ